VIEAMLAENLHQTIKIGDTVHSIIKPFHHRQVTRFNKKKEFVFIQTSSGKEESKALENNCRSEFA